ncbi:indigoidine synthase A family protein [Coprinopsis marcescibilis]|uniref:Indigoidine synthase A family protein n=1 Tax=Coprinopsis marcescibilis TaxID=230819 RepID=A0A5C3LCY7_COPMA|nr:indigoidine synthase A family protein [Coprinopsis marcescibilis]
MLRLRHQLQHTVPRQAIRRGDRNYQLLSSLRQSGAPVDVHPEVEDALARGLPVVSLETALVTHGLPYPANLEVPLALENTVRSTGSIPATIALVGGRVKIGLERHELERLAERREKPAKISRRDISSAIATNQDGGTTCSATLVFSALAGIKVFATGGLGGVHRGAETSLDVSADLQELTRCPVGLVSSGVKSILDIGRWVLPLLCFMSRISDSQKNSGIFGKCSSSGLAHPLTLKALQETAGVPVVAYSKTNEFPAFFSRYSGHNVPWNVEDPVLAAKMILTQQQLNMRNGIIFAAPIPEEYEASGETIQLLVNQAVKESEENGVARSGKEVTPWLLARVLELSGGRSLESNIALLQNNALIGGRIAVEYAKLKGSVLNEPCATRAFASTFRTLPFSTDISRPQSAPAHPAATNSGPANIVVIGCSALDITSKADSSVDRSLAPHSTVPGSVSLTLGGVARNIAEAASRSAVTAYPGVSSLLLSPIGGDMFGHLMVEEVTRRGMRNDGLITLPERTAVCNMVLDGEGALVGGVADMDVTEDFSHNAIVPRITAHAPELVAFDGNITAETMMGLVDHCRQSHIKVLFEPTSVSKSSRILPAVGSWLKTTNPKKPLITHFTPNVLELIEVYEQARSDEYDLMSHSWWWDNVNNLSLGSNFRMEVEQLARRNVRDDDSAKGTMSFLTQQGIAQMAVHLLPFFQHIWIKCGVNGAIAVMQISADDAKISGFARERTNIAKRCIIAHGLGGEILVLQHFPSLHVDSLINVTGAGDSFVGTLIAGLAHDSKQMYNPTELERLVNTAQRAAGLTLQSHEAVSPLLSDLVRDK